MENELSLENGIDTIQTRSEIHWLGHDFDPLAGQLGYLKCRGAN